METQGFYLTRVPTDERSDRFLLSTSMSSSDIFRALRLVVFPPRVLNRDFTDFFQTLAGQSVAALCPRKGENDRTPVFGKNAKPKKAEKARVRKKFP